MYRNYSLDLLRILACISVIMIHSAGSPIYHNMVDPGTLYYNECLVMDALSRWSVPIFVMLTGYLMINPQKEMSIKSLLSKNILRIFLSLCFWSIFYALTLNKNILPLGSQEGHLWYLGMVIGLYLSLPILRLIANNKKLLEYFLIVWCVFEFYKFMGAFIMLPIKSLDYLVFADYAGYCLLGYYLSLLRLNNKMKLYIMCMGIISLIITVLWPIYTQNINSILGNYTSPNVIMTSVFIFLICLNIPIKNIKIGNLLTEISNCTFGIYLIHIYLLIHFFRFHKYIPHPIILCPILVFFCFIGGYIITKLIKKIPIIGKFIV